MKTIIAAILCGLSFVVFADTTNAVEKIIKKEKIKITNPKFSSEKMKKNLVKTKKINKIRKLSVSKFKKAKTISERGKQVFQQDYLKTLENSSDNVIESWSDIISDHETCNIEYIKNTKQFRIQNEVKLYNNEYDDEILKNNLTLLKSLGYDSILVRFDCTEDVTVLQSLVKEIKTEGFNIFLTYSGDNYLDEKWSVFTNVGKIETFLKTLAPEATGLLLNWGFGTSINNYIIPEQYYNYICNTARKYNDSILIYGEVFYGKVNRQYESSHSVHYNIPKNVTGIVVSNFGFYNNNRKYALEKMFKQYVPNFGDLDVIGLSLGIVTTRKTMSFQDEYKSKKYVEDSFRSLNCSTISNFRNVSLREHNKPETADTTKNILYNNVATEK